MGQGPTESSLIMPVASDSVQTKQVEIEIEGAADTPGLLDYAPKRTGSMPFAMANLSNTILGAGMLGFPYAFASCGFTLGIVLVFVSGLGSALGLHLLAFVANRIDEHNEVNANSSDDAETKKANHLEPSYFAAARISYPILAIIIDLAIVAKCFGVASSYLIVIGELMPSVFEYFGWGGPHDIMLDRRTWITLTMVFPIIQLAFLPRINMLRFTSIIALISVIYLVFIVIFYTFNYKDIPGNTHFPSSSITSELWGAVLNFDLFNTLPVFVFGFTCHQNLFPIYRELHDPTAIRVNTIIGCSVFSCFCIYELISILGFLTLGTAVSSNIIYDYPNTILVIIGQFAITILVMLSYPLQSFPLRNSLDKVVSQTIVAIQEWRKRPVDPEAYRDARYITETLLICGASYALTMVVSDLGVVFALVGATGSTTICYILPGLFYYGINRDKPWEWRKVLAVFMFCFGVAFMIISCTVIIKGIFTGEDSPSG